MRSGLSFLPSDDLLSQDPAVQVPSALRSLTSVFGMGTGVTFSPSSLDVRLRRCVFPENWMRMCVARQLRISPRPISTGQLNASRHVHLQPINHVFYMGSYHVNRVGSLILRWASRLDAFSAYPFPTWLLSDAVGTTTETPAVGSSRSSRTKDNSSQTSCARGR